jgi:hypothetical protein
MPLLAYFGVVGSILVGLLYVAEAQLGPPTTLSITTNFYGLPPPYKAASAPILTVRNAPAPDMSKPVVAQPAVFEAQPPRTRIASERKTKKPQKAHRQTVSRHLFADSDPRKNHRVW